jgi:competence protein ComEA
VLRPTVPFVSRTQDLVLARLRLIALRWQAGGAEPGAPGDDPDEEGSRDPDEGVRAGAEWADEAVPADAPGHAAGPLGVGVQVGDPGPPPWPAAGIWVRLVALLVVLVVIGGTAALLTSWPREQQGEAVSLPGPAQSGDPLADPFLASSPSPAPQVTVHVVGEVRNPGVVRLPAGSRVVDAVRAAGGLRHGGKLGATNLARILADGERIDVGGQGAAASGGAAAPAGGSGGPLDLNSATAEQLDALPGIGPVTAAKIIAWRSTHARFTVVDELAEVPGIGPKTLADLRPLVRV